jgi:hypothetical protein
MSNPLALVATRPSRLSKQEWVDRGNAHLVEIGRAHELHWYLHDGQVKVGWK